MARETRTILIESILGGQSPMTHFSGADQFKASLGIDPALPAVDNNDVLFRESGIAASGLIRPAPYASLAESNNTTMMATPMWLLQNPKNGLTYVYDAVGSIYTIGSDYYASFSALGDMNDTGGSIGNGGAYYDNYMYFATKTTIARYGPLNGTPAFTDDYWVTTLSKTALSDTAYPVVEVEGGGKYSLDLDVLLSQYAYINSPNYTNLDITGDMSIESWLNFRNLPGSGSKYGIVSMGRSPNSVGNSYSIDLERSSSQYLSATDSTSLSITGDLTVEAWIRLESLPASGEVYPIICKSASNNISFEFVYQNAGGLLKFSTSISNNGTSPNGANFNSTLTVNTWYHVAMVYSASIGTVSVYLNGILISSDSSMPSSIFNGNASLQIGGGVFTSGTGYFDGQIDDVRIWAESKSSTELLESMEVELTGVETNLNAYWKLNNVLTDLTTNANTLTNNNNAVFTTSVPFGGWVSYWNLDNSLTDSIGSRTLTNNGGVTFVNGVVGSSASFLGTSQTLSRTSETIGIANEWSISGWIKPDVSTGNLNFLKWIGASNFNNITAFVSSNYLRLQIRDSAGILYKDYTCTTTQFNIDAWNHIIVTWDGTNLIMYINNVLQSVTKLQDDAITQTDTARVLTIGEQDSIKIDEIGLVSRVLSSSEISELYNNGSGSVFSSDSSKTYEFYCENDGSNQYLSFNHLNSSLQTETVQTQWAPVIGTWYHVACTIAGSTVAFYVNGVAQGSTGTISYTRSHNASSNLKVGATTLSQSFDGQIDEVRIWNDDISASDILTNMNLEISGATASLVSYWKFDNDYLDANANNNHLSGLNSPVFSTRVPFGLSTVYYPNHVMKRHSDGKLYFADVVGNQGVLHIISTTKTTVEGDTDNGSTFNALDFGYGLYPTAIESYGSSIVVALYEGSDAGVRGPTSKIAFWDTTSNNFNSIVFTEFPDSIVTSMKNINGVLYFVSTNSKGRGFRLSRLVGANTIQEIAYNEFGQAPLAGGVDGTAQRILFGSATQVPKQAACVFSYGLQKSALGQGLHNIASFNDAAMVTSLILPNMSSDAGDANSGFGFYTPMVGWSGGDTDGEVSVIKRNGPYNTQVFWDKMYRIGKPFQIKKIQIPLAQAVAEGMGVNLKLYMDGGATVYDLKPINNTNDPGKYNIVRKAGSNSEALKGQNSFFLAFEWDSTILCTISFPITIEYELLDET